MSTPKNKPSSRVASILVSPEALLEQSPVFAVSEEAAAAPQVARAKTPAVPEGKPAKIEAPPAKVIEEEQKPKGKGRGRKKKDKSEEEKPEKIILQVLIDREFEKRLDAYVNSPHALYKNRSDLVRQAIRDSLDTLEPILEQASKFYEKVLNKKGG